MRNYINRTTGQKVSWNTLKRLLHASIPFGTEHVEDWDLEPEPELVEPEPAERAPTVAERLDDIENALIELAGIIAGEASPQEK